MHVCIYVCMCMCVCMYMHIVFDACIHEYLILHIHIYGNNVVTFGGDNHRPRLDFLLL